MYKSDSTHSHYLQCFDSNSDAPRKSRNNKFEGKNVGIVVDISTLQNSRQDKLANASETEEVQQGLMKKCKICGPNLTENSILKSFHVVFVYFMSSFYYVEW